MTDINGDWSAPSSLMNLNCEKIKQDELNFCVICCAEIRESSSQCNGPSDLVSKNVTMIFLLRKMLEVPGSQLEETLKECGDPVSWIKLCEQCAQLTRQAENLHCKIAKIEKEIRRVQCLIVERVKLSSSKEFRCGRGMDLKTNWRRTRELFARKCKLNDKPLLREDVVLDNPFIEGDKLAEYLVSQQKQQQPTENIKVEVEAEEEEDDTIFQDDWSQNYDDEEIQLKMETIEENDVKEVSSKRRVLKERESAYSNKRRGRRVRGTFGSSILMQKKRKNRKMIRIDGKLKCRYCDKLFAAMSTCLLHEKQKHPEVPGQFICDICGKPWNSRDYLRDHRRSVHGINPQGIPVASNKKKEKTDKTENGAKIIKRSSASLSIAGYRKSNRKVERIDGKLKCRDCDKLFAAMSTLLLHEKQKHPEVPGQFICDICGKPWNSRDYLRDHRRNVHGLNPRGIPVVSNKKKKTDDLEGGAKIFKRSSSSSIAGYRKSNNRKVEKIDGKLKCRYCDKLFVAYSSLHLHEKEKHASTPGEFICDICGKAWNSRDYLRDHKRKTHGINPDGSQVVLVSKKMKKEDNKLDDGGEEMGEKKEVKSRRVSTKSSDEKAKKIRKEKMAIENIDGKWKCRHCDQLFGGKSSVYVHEREKHAQNEGQFICDLCGKSWNSRDYLSNHRRNTHGINPDGSRVEILKRKEKIKVKSEKTNCRYCDTVFSSHRICTYHEKEKHSDSPAELICDICGMAWKTQHYLRKHKRNKHKVNSDGTPAKEHVQTKKSKQTSILTNQIEFF